eukprot:TRINITY_DN9509_c0_g1_i1.p1 TRINITY_DN9509_c0_g1~~TRINITY_DN9509_c0_g1_i1.p1  ORF type:complete len:181 (-),score=38.26 TRINITY_DN9509_c0_g1_i1:143-685(-)
MVRRLWVGNICWYVYLFANLFYASMNMTGKAIHSTTIIRLVYRLAEIGIALTITSMIDQKTNIVLLTKWVFGRVEIVESSSRSTIQSSMTYAGGSDTSTNTTNNTSSVPSKDSVAITIVSPFSPDDDEDESDSEYNSSISISKKRSNRSSKRSSKKSSKKSSQRDKKGKKASESVESSSE